MPPHCRRENSTRVIPQHHDQSNVAGGDSQSAHCLNAEPYRSSVALAQSIPSSASTRLPSSLFDKPGLRSSKLCESWIVVVASAASLTTASVFPLTKRTIRSF